MRKVFGILVLFLISNTTVVAAVTSVTSPIPSLQKTNFTESQIESCIESTCGSAPQNIGAKNAFPKNYMSDPGFLNFWRTEIQGGIDEVSEENAKSNQTTMDALKNFYQLKPQVELSPELKVLLNYSKLIGPFSSKVDKIYEFKNNKYVFNQVNFDALTVKLPDFHKKLIKYYIIKYVKPQYDLNLQRLLHPWENTLNLKLKLLFPGVDLPTAQKIYALQAKEKAEKLVALGSVWKLFAPRRVIDLFERASTGKNLSKIDSESFLNYTALIDGAIDLTSGPLYQALVDIPVTNENVFDDKTKLKVLTSAQKWAKKTPAIIRGEITDACKKKAALLFQENPSEVKISEIKVIIEEVKLAALELLPRYVERRALGQVSRSVRESTFVVPERSSNELLKLRNTLIDQRKSDLEATALLNRHDNQAYEALIAAITVFESSMPDDDKGTVVDLCNEWNGDTISDFSVTSFGQISISWFTIEHPEVGMATFAHEMGHVVAASLRAAGGKGANIDLFSNSWNCVADRNPFLINPVHLDVNTETQWSEEDWADHFSALILDELERENSPIVKNTKNWGCALLEDDGLTYNNNSLTPTIGDAHSSGFLRMLLTGQDRHNLSSACQPFLDYARQSNRNLECN